MFISGRQFGGEVQLGEMSDRGKNPVTAMVSATDGKVGPGNRGGGWLGLEGQLDGEEEAEEKHTGLLTH